MFEPQAFKTTIMLFQMVLQKNHCKFKMHKNQCNMYMRTPFVAPLPTIKAHTVSLCAFLGTSDKLLLKNFLVLIFGTKSN